MLMNHIRTGETRRDQIITFIAEYATEHHNAPSTLEIAAAFEISQQTVYGHMVKLMAERRLIQVDGRWKIPNAEYTPPVEL
jgi:predicted transcriptional regulator